MMTAKRPTLLAFFFEWGGGCLWAGDSECIRRLGPGPYDLRDPCPLPLSLELLARCQDLGVWHDGSLNWDSPIETGPWPPEEFDRFDTAAKALLAEIRRELGQEFQVIDIQRRCMSKSD